VLRRNLDNLMPHFSCNLDLPGTHLRPIWNHTVGSGHAALALRADWREQMRRTQADLGVRYVRFHGILCDDMATFLVEDGKEVHSFSNIDQIFDFLLSIHMRPFIEFGFMPTALASGDTTVFRYKANVTPPNNWRKWNGLIKKLVQHWVDRYGAPEVRLWFFEVWNEPNLRTFWTGTQAEYFKLYKGTVHAIKSVDAHLRVGGPATADDQWIDQFLTFCEQNNLSADFVSTHHYPTDALGKPGDDTERELSLASRGELRERTLKTFHAAGGKPVCYTEWCSSSNPFDHLHDEPFASAFLMKNMLDVADLVEAYSWWTFSDIFEENYFPSTPFHGGFGLQTIHGTPKPTYRAMQILNNVGDERLQVDGTHHTVDAWTIKKSDGTVTVLLTNHAFPKHAIQTESVTLTLNCAHQPVKLSVQRIDLEHGNARRTWEAMGSPEFPDAHQLQIMEKSSQLDQEPLASIAHEFGTEFTVNLPPHAIAAIQLDYPLIAGTART
jgi:xylan 1,4-beta-xylosidase